MKKLSLLLLVASVALFGCKKDDNGGSGGDAPESYTQKVILEYFSGAWCGYCPDGKFMAEEVKSKVPAGTFDYVVYHLADQMDILDDDDIDDAFAAGYPTGMINRLGGEASSRYTGSLQTYDQYNPEKNNLWLITTKEVQNTTAKCGLAVDATAQSGDNLTVKVKLGIGPESLPAGSYYMTVLVYESEMTGTGTGWDQVNYFSKFGSAVFGASHPYYNLSDPIQGYVHTNSVRAVLNNNALGDKIDASATEAGTLTEYSFTLNTKPFDSDLKVAAWIWEYKESAVEPKSRIHNVQFVSVGNKIDFD
jgi:hypothetical protein